MKNSSKKFSVLSPGQEFVYKVAKHIGLFYVFPDLAVRYEEILAVNNVMNELIRLIGRNSALNNYADFADENYHNRKAFYALMLCSLSFFRQKHQVLKHLGLSYNQIEYELWRLQVEFDDLYIFYIAMSRFPDAFEALIIKDEGAAEMISRIQEEKFKKTLEYIISGLPHKSKTN